MQGIFDLISCRNPFVQLLHTSMSQIVCMQKDIKPSCIAYFFLRPPHTWENKCLMISKLLWCLCGDSCQSRLTGISTDGAASIVGCLLRDSFSARATKFLDFLPRVVRSIPTWFANAVCIWRTRQEIVSWYAYRFGSISHNANKFDHKDECKIPFRWFTRWRSLGNACRWIVRYRDDINQHVDAQRWRQVPDASWWIFYHHKFDTITSVFNVCFTLLELRDT